MRRDSCDMMFTLEEAVAALAAVPIGATLIGREVSEARAKPGRAGGTGAVGSRHGYRGYRGLRIRSVRIDSRECREGDLFVALKGSRTDGHLFVADAFRRGAVAAVAERDVTAELAQDGVEPRPLILVRDSLLALGELGRLYRSKFDVTVVGVTGSAGKTTTKEMIFSVLTRRFSVLKNEANYNNEIGVPLTLFGLRAGHEVAVVEMAMRGLGEIARLSYIARPRIGVVTNVGPAHVERLGTLDNILKAKWELAENLEANGVMVVNGDDPMLRKAAASFRGRCVLFGLFGFSGVAPAETGWTTRVDATGTTRADAVLRAAATAAKRDSLVTATAVKSLEGGRTRFVPVYDGQAGVEVILSVPGRHNVYNALAAAAVGWLMGLDYGEISSALEEVSPSRMRGEVLTVGGITIIDDSYNANPLSMRASIEAARSIARCGRLIAVFGDMLELGEDAEQYHRDVGMDAAREGIDVLVTVGELARFMAEGGREAGIPSESVFACRDHREAAGVLAKIAAPDDVVLVKGSRGSRMDLVVDMLYRLRRKGGGD